MSNVVNRTTVEYRTSVDTTQYSSVDWIINPDLSALASVPQMYWKVAGDTVIEMTQGEKDAVDAAIEANRVASVMTAISDNIVIPDPIARSTDIAEYVAEDSVWTDPVSGLHGPPDLMTALVNRREIFGDSENPLGSYAGNILSRLTLEESLHDKGSWHREEIFEAGYYRPFDLMIYYGWLNSFNSGTNGWNNELVAREFAHYEVLVVGNGLADPSHGDYANTAVIIPRVKQFRPSIKLLGYVDGALSLANFQTAVDQWNTLGATGIFIDQAGYDYGTTTTNARAAMNAKIDYIHGKSVANVVMVNAWNMDHIIGTANDASYPNTTWNPDLLASHLWPTDWYLLESTPINTTAYSGNAGYQSKSDWAVRCVKAIGHRYTYKINLAACGIINDDNANGQDLFDFGFVSAMMFTLEAWGCSDTAYGSSSAKSKWYPRPDVTQLGLQEWLNPSVQEAVDDADVYYRYTQCGRFKLDFSAGAQTSDIEKFTGLLSAGAPLSVFGNDYHTAIATVRSTTTSVSFQNKVALTTGVLTGTYRIGWTAVIDQSSSSYQTEAQLFNNTDSLAVGVLEILRPNNAANRVHVGGFAEVTFTGAAKTFYLQYRTNNASGTAGMADARIEIWRVA